MKINFINSSYKRFYHAHKQEIDRAISRCLKVGDLVLRKDVSDFEIKLASFVGTKYAIGVGSGTDALFLSLKALGIKEGDEVITVSHTFIATIQAIVHCGATPILVDVGLDEQMAIAEVEKAITKKTKAIIPVHFHGKMVDMDELMRIAKDIPIVEDAAQALGASWNNKKAGSYGVTGCFSFNTPKLLGAYGDAGGITTNSKELCERLLLLRNHWNIAQTSVRKEDFPQPELMGWGWKSRLDNIQAAVLNVKFKHFKAMLKKRKQIGEMYNDGLQDLPVGLPLLQDGMVYQEYILCEEKRNAFQKHMQEQGIELLIRDTIPNHELPGLRLDHFNLPITERLAKICVRLPLYPELTYQEVRYIIRAVRSFYGK